MLAASRVILDDCVEYGATDDPGAFVTLDSGQRERFGSGARRDTQVGKPRYDLMPPGPLRRVAELYARGAAKYDDHNWAKGMPTSRALASLMRHLYAGVEGESQEDHWAAVVFNAFAIMHFQGTEHDDMHDWSPGGPEGSTP